MHGNTTYSFTLSVQVENVRRRPTTSFQCRNRPFLGECSRCERNLHVATARYLHDREGPPSEPLDDASDRLPSSWEQRGLTAINPLKNGTPRCHTLSGPADGSKNRCILTLSGSGPAASDSGSDSHAGSLQTSSGLTITYHQGASQRPTQPYGTPSWNADRSPTSRVTERLASWMATVWICPLRHPPGRVRLWRIGF